MRVLLTGGGTSGHIYPALCVARAFRESGYPCELLFVGSRYGPEGDLARRENIPFEWVPSSPLSRSISPRILITIGQTTVGIAKALIILRRFKPDVAIGTGGYASAGVLVAQWLRGGRIIIHEQNVVPGRTNRLLSRIATRVCATFEETLQYLPASKTVVTGMPVRPEFLEPPEQKAARKQLGLEEDRFTLLVTGGSQGARRLNELVLSALPMLEEAGVQILHQTGAKNFEDVMAAIPHGAEHYHVRPYIHEMAAAYSAADLVLARSGSGTIADLTAVGRPAILVPYPYAGGHQRENAHSIASRGAAIAVEEADLSAEIIAALVIDLMRDKERLDAMAAASAALARKDAAEKIIRVAMETLDR